MVNQELIDYIKKQIDKNISKDLIISRLTEAGWRQSDIDEGFAQVGSPAQAPTVSPSAPQKEEKVVIEEKPKTYIDPYRELPTESPTQKPLSANISQPKPQTQIAQKPEPPKVWKPESVKPVDSHAFEVGKPTEPELKDKVDTEPKNENKNPVAKAPEAEVQKPKPQTPVMNTVPKEDKPVMTKAQEDVQSIMKEANIKTPQSDNKSATPDTFVVPDKKDSKSVIYVIPDEDVDEKVNAKPQVVLNEDKKAPSAFTLSASDVASGKVENLMEDVLKQKPPAEKEEMKTEVITETKPIEDITKKTDSKPKVIEMTPESLIESLKISQNVFSNGKKNAPPAPVSKSNSLPESAMISSYAKDFSSVKKMQEEKSQHRPKKKFPKWLLVFIILILVGGGTAFAAVSGYIHLPVINLNLSFIKKNPKDIIAGTPNNLKSLKSYKMDASINISLPAFSNITSSLLSGEEISSGDKDSISITLNGRVNHSGLVAQAYDFDAVFDSSILQNDIPANFKFDGINTFVKVPDLSQFFKQNTPESATVAMTKDQWTMIISELPDNIKTSITNGAVYKALSNNYFKQFYSSFEDSFQNFANNMVVVEKEEEDIHGIPSRHYAVNTEGKVLKEFLVSASNIFASQLTDENKKNLEESLGAVSMNSMQVWIGKSDNLVHQYKFIATIPLSKVLGFTDKGIADNVVKLEVKASYYDFDVANNISMPSDAIDIGDFIRVIHDAKIKNKVLSFAAHAQAVKNAEGSFGRSNSSGSCIEPDSGSLFSPLGHKNGALVAVGEMASLMTSILNDSNGNGFCYSTYKDWAIQIPMSSTPDEFFCADSMGTIASIPNPITSSVCK